ncbi:DUF1127 domain-containing protein [Falsirhodobacter xinxiangensis]|uniref:DUF1127 domain-containing protein n=1 Tax=Falsirhodobacter xinxiangensis TaxID=2530049 RepID=UPI0010AA4E36|nr:DUF1127 domain-containing protein [Rhodobacter xinxiangensis]
MAQAITRGNELQLDGFAAIVRSIKAAIERRRVFNQTVAELNLLTVRELGDLGITRSSIRSVAREAAYGN